MPEDDSELLLGFAREESEAGFGEIVRRHIDFVYQTALREVGGDAHSAADVTRRPPPSGAEGRGARASSRLERMAMMYSHKRSDGSASNSPLAGPPVGVAENVIGLDDVDLVQRNQISPDKIKDYPPQRVHRFPDGWKFVWPSATGEEKKAMIDATPPTQREMLGKN